MSVHLCSALQFNFTFVLCCLPPALDADLRFALDSHPDNDIMGRCLVYIHKVVNAEGEKRQMNSPSQPQSEARVIHHFPISTDLFATFPLTLQTTWLLLQVFRGICHFDKIT